METLSWLISEWGSVGWVQSLAILLGALLLAKVVEWILCSVVGRLARRTRTRVDDQAVQILRRPVFASVLITGLILALPPLALPPGPVSGATRLLETLLLVIWLGTGMRLSSAVLRALSSGPLATRRVHASAVPLLDNTVRVVLVGGAAYFAFLIWHIDLTAWLASAGIIGIAVGFAAKDTLGNLFAGVFILIDAPYKVGDYVVLDGEDRGQVTHIGLRSTRLLTRDDVEIIIPNSVIGGAKIINESGGPWPKYRIRIRVGVAYGSDVDHVRRVLEEVAASTGEVCTDPAPRVRFRAFGDSSLDFELLCWIDEPGARGLVSDLLHTDVYKRFAAEGIVIPFPQRDLHFKLEEACHTIDTSSSPSRHPGRPSSPPQ
ncbi:MAG: mechanosensitive ion channel family protein [Acidobacteriota bacterium]|nr:mechanosensitive ion channel family protein [Acidobacteriota bacterium]